MPTLARADQAFDFLTLKAGHLDSYRSLPERIRDNFDVREIPKGAKLEQWLMDAARRCTDCGVRTCGRGVGLPTTHGQGCTLNNPHEWIDYVARGDLRGAIRVHNQTTLYYLIYGALCYGPCEHGCIHSDNPLTKGVRSKTGAVSIKDIEYLLGLFAYENNLLIPGHCKASTFKRVAIVGSGPAGLEAAHKLSLEGHHVTVFDALDKPGGLVRYEIPAFKMPKEYLDFTIGLYLRQGIEFVCNNKITTQSQAESLVNDFDVVILATGAPATRYSMRGSTVDFKKFSQVVGASSLLEELERSFNRGEMTSLAGKNVVIVGNKLTAADVIGKTIRAGANVTVIDTHPVVRKELAKLTSAHTELVYLAKKYPERFSILGNRTISDMKVQDGRLEITAADNQGGLPKTLIADTVAMAIGYEGADNSVHELFGLTMSNERSISVAADRITGLTANPKIIAVGDCAHGPSVLVEAGAMGNRGGRTAHCLLTGQAPGPSLFRDQASILIDSGSFFPVELLR